MMLSVLIVHYDTTDLLRRCLESLGRAKADFPLEVFVVDNASPDRRVETLAEEFPDVTFHFNEENIGFARANNQAFRKTQGRYVLLLNPDVVFDRGGLAQLVDCMEQHRDVGACAPRLTYPDGRTQLSCRSFPTILALSLRISRLDRFIRGPVRRYLMTDWDHADIREVDWVVGACVMFRRAALEAVGLLDEAYFMYAEDIDVCLRLKEKGWKVLYDPNVSVTHDHRRESARLPPNRLSWVHAQSVFRLAWKRKLAWW